MTNFSVIENKITAINKYLDIVRKYQKYSKTEIENDFDLKGAVERYLYLVSQASVDLAEAVISFKNFRKPTTFREGFEILGEKDVLSKDLVEKMIKMAGFRNIIANDYEKINYDIVLDVLNNRLGDIEEFVSAIKKNLSL